MDKPTTPPETTSPALIYAELERRAARKGYHLARCPAIGFVLRRGTVSKHFGNLETGFALLRQP